MLELVNHARLDPLAEADFFDIDLNEGLEPNTISSDPKMPLAMNTLLIDAARDHSQWMLDANTFSHTGEGGSTIGERIQAAGYEYSLAGENIAWIGQQGTIDLVDAIYDHHEGLFLSPGHRVNILREGFYELGVGQRAGSFTNDEGIELDASSMLTQNFGRSSEGDETFFITGVMYEDIDNDDFYSVGEGLSGVVIEFEDAFYETFGAGAYALPVSAGTHDLIFYHDEFEEPIAYTVDVADANFKLDIIGDIPTEYGIEYGV